MWKLIDDCPKQITLKTSLRESNGPTEKIYAITEIEFDQYHIVLTSKNNEPVVVPQQSIITCAQLKKYGFEYKVAGS